MKTPNYLLTTTSLITFTNPRVINSLNKIPTVNASIHSIIKQGGCIIKHFFACSHTIYPKTKTSRSDAKPDRKVSFSANINPFRFLLWRPTTDR